MRPTIFAPSILASASMSVPGLTRMSNSLATRRASFGGAHLLRGVLHRRAENVKARRRVGLRHEREIQIAEQHFQRVAGRQVFEFYRSVSFRARLDKNMPAGLMRDVFQQRPERFAVNVGAHPVGRGVPDEGIVSAALALKENASNRQNKIGRTLDIGLIDDLKAPSVKAFSYFFAVTVFTQPDCRDTSGSFRGCRSQTCARASSQVRAESCRVNGVTAVVAGPVLDECNQFARIAAELAARIRPSCRRSIRTMRMFAHSLWPPML